MTASTTSPWQIREPSVRDRLAAVMALSASLGRRAVAATARPPLLFNEAVNFDKKAIFIAVPKTGTTSIRKQLAVRGPKLIPNPHLTILQVRDGLYTYFLSQGLGNNRHFPTRPDEVPSDAEIRGHAARTFHGFFKFASVRNPWARVVSLYHRREGVQTADKMDFERFCEGLRYASDTCAHTTRMSNQLDWMVDENGKLAVDYVLKLEDLDNGLKEINARTAGRLALKEKRCNCNPRSPSVSYRKAYSDKSRAIVADIFHRDITFFGYSF